MKISPKQRQKYQIIMNNAFELKERLSNETDIQILENIMELVNEFYSDLNNNKINKNSNSKQLEQIRKKYNSLKEQYTIVENKKNEQAKKLDKITKILKK